MGTSTDSASGGEGTTDDFALWCASPDSREALAFAVAALQALPSQAEDRWSSRHEQQQQQQQGASVLSPNEPQLRPRSATQAALKKKFVLCPKKEEPQQPFEDGFNDLSASSEHPDMEAAVPVIPLVSAGLKRSAASRSRATTELNTDRDDEAARLQRSRERNREHARRTRLRKKAALQELQTKITELKATKASLQQQQQDKSIASILLGLNSSASSGNAPAEVASANTTRTATPSLDHEQPQSGSKRKRSSAPSQKPLQVHIEGKGIVTISSQVNWKTGTYMDEEGMTQQLNPEELELLR